MPSAVAMILVPLPYECFRRRSALFRPREGGVDGRFGEIDSAPGGQVATRPGGRAAACQVNVELASPGHFIPVPPGWEERSPFIARHGLVSFFHYDLYAQALSKIERRHERDRTDVREMIRRGLVEPAKGREYFARIEPELYRFPAIDPPSFARAVADELGPPAS